MLPSTHFARSGDLHIGYQVLGDGPFDLLFVPGIISHLDLWWDDPRSARFFERLASFSRLILLDKRGLGVSDRVAGWATLEERMDDLRAVMDAAGSESAALVGVSEGGPLSLLFAAAHPERCSALCVVGGFARMVRGDDYPYGVTRQQMLNLFEEVVANWGKPGLMRLIAPTLWSRPEEHEGWGRFERAAASPGAIRSGIEMNSEIDVRHVLPQIRVPTLVVHRRQDRAIPFGMGEYLADHIPGARMVALEGKDHLFWLEGDEVVDAIQEFLTGEHAPAPVDRVLATVLFIDIVESTRRVAEQGDRAWVETLVRFKTIVQRQLERFSGHEVDDAGDGVLATGLGPDTLDALARSLGQDAPALRAVVDHLVRQNLIVRVTSNLYFEWPAVEELRAKVVDFLTRHDEIDPAAYKTLTGQSRKHTVPLMEFFDAEKLTIRRDNVRVLRRRGD